MKQEIRTLLIALMAFMLVATMLIRFIDYTAGDRVSTLSLREVEPPSGEALFMVDGSPYARYFRSAVGIEYNGDTWGLQKIAEVQKYLDENSDEGEVLSPEASFLSRKYGDFNRDMLNELSTLDDLKCLELPDNITDRVKELSLRITDGMPTPFEKAHAIEEFLQVKFEYNLSYPPQPSGWEPNDWFLFESREGVCGNFNSAFVVLARASGIPARLATGYYFLPGNGEPQPVYPSQAHAWAEVGFEDVGWLVFEATPS